MFGTRLVGASGIPAGHLPLPHRAPPAAAVAGATAMALLLGGCASKEVACYAGTSELHLRDGGLVPLGANLARRTLEPSKNTITEDVIAPGGPGAPSKEFIVDMIVTGNTLSAEKTIFDSGGAPQMSISERFETISEAEFLRCRTAMLGPAAPGSAASSKSGAPGSTAVPAAAP